MGETVGERRWARGESGRGWGGRGILGLGEERKGHSERRATARRLEHLDGALVGLDDGRDDREPEAAAARAAVARGVGAPEALEDLAADLLGDALAVVDD